MQQANLQQTVLVVDDTPENIMIMTEILRDLYRVKAATNGRKALLIAESENPPDIILLDIMMPEMDGYEVCRQLSKNTSTKSIPVIFVTAMGQEEDETKGLELGAVDYITKPVSPAIVRARVKTQLTLKNNMAELRSAYAIIEAQKERMQTELNVGREIQMSMVPCAGAASIREDDYQLYSILHPARTVGGDLYYFQQNGNILHFVIGDVSDKGVAAALFMAKTVALYTAALNGKMSPCEIFTYMNRALFENNTACMFVTALCGSLNLATGELVMANAGHLHPIQKTQSTSNELVVEGGMPLGLMEDTLYQNVIYRLAPETSLLMYTDGISEAFNPTGSQYEEEKLLTLIEQTAEISAESLGSLLLADVEKFIDTAEQSDDITLMVIHYNSINQKPAPSDRIELSQNTSECCRLYDFLTSGVDHLKLSKEFLHELKLVSEEILVNIISHGGDGRSGDIVEVALSIDTESVHLTFIDSGRAFNPLQHNDGAVDKDFSAGGMGITLVKSLTDKQMYVRDREQNKFTVSKNYIL